MDAKNFAKEYYQLEKSNVEIVSVESAITFAEKYHALQLQQGDVSGSDIEETTKEAMELIDYMHQLTVVPDNLIEDYANRFANTMNLLAQLRNHYC